jgi:hypothetical protein
MLGWALKKSIQGATGATNAPEEPGRFRVDKDESANFLLTLIRGYDSV